MAEPNIVRLKLLNCQICVPKSYTDRQAEDCANSLAPTGIDSLWHIDTDIEPKRAQCVKYEENVHIVMVC
jgi:hypothetical protein